MATYRSDFIFVGPRKGNRPQITRNRNPPPLHWIPCLIWALGNRSDWGRAAVGNTVSGDERGEKVRRECLCSYGDPGDARVPVYLQTRNKTLI
jgi:hypothetical protein